MPLKQISPVLLSLESAEKAIEAAVVKVQEIGVPYPISVVDGAGLLVAAPRMDGAAIASIDTSLASPEQDHDVAVAAVAGLGG